MSAPPVDVTIDSNPGITQYIPYDSVPFDHGSDGDTSPYYGVFRPMSESEVDELATKIFNNCFMPIYVAPQNLEQFSEHIKQYVDERTFPEAPADGKQYVRQDGQWSEIIISSINAETINKILAQEGFPVIN